MALRNYPSFELKAQIVTLKALASELVGIAFAAPGEVTWLQDRAGRSYPIYISQRDLEPKFEVFSLDIPTRAEMEARVARWEPPAPPQGGKIKPGDPRYIRPMAPDAPTVFEAWPLRNYEMKILRRAEFIIEDVDVSSVGDAPNSQGAAAPGHVPKEASASCEVAVGLLFTAMDGAQLMIAADWFPFHTLVTNDAEEISAFRESCEAVPLSDYLERLDRIPSDRG